MYPFLTSFMLFIPEKNIKRLFKARNYDWTASRQFYVFYYRNFHLHFHKKGSLVLCKKRDKFYFSSIQLFKYKIMYRKFV